MYFWTCPCLLAEKLYATNNTEGMDKEMV